LNREIPCVLWAQKKLRGIGSTTKVKSQKRKHSAANSLIRVSGDFLDEANVYSSRKRVFLEHYNICHLWLDEKSK